MPSIEIICPSRGRPERFRQMMESALSNATDPQRVTVSIGLDADDPRFNEYDTSGTTVTVFRKRIGAPASTQALIDKSNADYIMLGGDDCLYRTKRWDEFVVQAYERFVPEKLGLLAFDNGNGRKIPEAIGVSREWLKAVHPLFWPGFEHFWVDAVIMELACRFERLFCVQDITIEHMHFKYGKAEVDQTYTDTRTGGVDDRDSLRYRNIRPEIEAKVDAMAKTYGLELKTDEKTWRSHYRH